MEETRSPSSSPLSSIPDQDSIFRLSLSPSPIIRRSQGSGSSSSIRDTRSASSTATAEAAKHTVTVRTIEVDDSSPSPSPSSSPSPSPSKKPGKASPEQPTKRRPAAARKKLTKKLAANKKSKWNAENIISDPKSPLATANLRTILSNPIAWTILNKDEQAEILSLFPDQQHILDPGTSDARPNFASLLNDDSFRYDCAAYTANLALGRHDPEWLAQAWAAHERRKAGDFEDYLVDKLRNEWGVEMPDEMKMHETTVMTQVFLDKGLDAVPMDMETEPSSDIKMDLDATEGNG